MASKANLSGGQAANIVKQGYILAAQNLRDINGEINENINISQLARICDTTRHTAGRWWGRRKEFEQTGVLQHKHRSGRPKHEAFANEEKVQEAVEWMEQQPLGTSQAEMAIHFGCHPNTLRNHTIALLGWYTRPFSQVHNKEKVAGQRVEFGEEITTNRPVIQDRKLKRKDAMATTIDHKKLVKFGLNRSHNKQPLQKNKDKRTRQLEKLPTSTNNPKIMVMFAANKKGTDLYRHAKPVRYCRKDGWHLEHQTVDGHEWAKGARARIIPFMQRTGSTKVFMDCVKVNHCAVVKEAFENAGIEVHPSAGAPHNVPGGYPPYSHQLSILDGFLFSPLQSQFSKHFLALKPHETDSAEMMMYREIIKVWKSPEWVQRSTEAHAKYIQRIRWCLETDGYMDNKKT